MGGLDSTLLPHHLRRRVMSPPHPFQGQTTDDGGKAGQVRSEADCQVHRRGALPWRCFAILLCFALGWMAFWDANSVINACFGLGCLVELPDEGDPGSQRRHAAKIPSSAAHKAMGVDSRLSYLILLLMSLLPQLYCLRCSLVDEIIM
jgi:hypothetical protein